MPETKNGYLIQGVLYEVPEGVYPEPEEGSTLARPYGQIKLEPADVFADLAKIEQEIKRLETAKKFWLNIAKDFLLD